MSSKSIAFTIRCWRDAQGGTTRLRIARVDQDKEVSLANSTFLVRAFIDEGHMTERCYIRHIASGREAYVQGGPGLSAFVEECLLAPQTSCACADQAPDDDM